MSNSMCFRRHARRTIDRAVSDGFAALVDDPAAQEMFARVLWAAGERSNLLQHGVAAVQAVLNLARFHAWHHAPVETWRGGQGHAKLLIHSLAQHLMGRYPVPRVLASAWFGDDSPPCDEERSWFIEHASGCPLRRVQGLPVQLTRKMERLLLTSPADLTVRAAIRRAELLALGAEPELVVAILQTDLARDLSHGEFWRSVFCYLIRHWEVFTPAQIEPIVKFLVATRLRGNAGTEAGQAPVPTFAAGRSPQALWQEIVAWRHEQQRAAYAERMWTAAGWGGLSVCELGATAVVWQIEELRTGMALRAEGRALRHCVATYVRRCFRGLASIWSLRSATGDGPFSSQFTIEVEPGTRQIVQIRGFANCRASGLPRDIIARWAQQEQLLMPSTC